MSRYEVLHYRGDLTESITEGQLLGCDEFGRPYAVIDAEFTSECHVCRQAVGETHLDFCSVDPFEVTEETAVGGHTTVNLEYATPDQIRAAVTS